MYYACFLLQVDEWPKLMAGGERKLNVSALGPNRGGANDYCKFDHYRGNTEMIFQQ